MEKIKPTQSERGFWQYGEFIDTYGAKVRVYESSAVRDDCVNYPTWVNIEGGNLHENNGTMHLNDEQLDYLIKLLQIAKEWRKG